MVHLCENRLPGFVGPFPPPLWIRTLYSIICVGWYLCWIKGVKLRVPVNRS